MSFLTELKKKAGNMSGATATTTMEQRFANAGVKKVERAPKKNVNPLFAAALERRRKEAEKVEVKQEEVKASEEEAAVKEEVTEEAAPAAEDPVEEEIIEEEIVEETAAEPAEAKAKEPAEEAPVEETVEAPEAEALEEEAIEEEIPEEEPAEEKATEEEPVEKETASAKKKEEPKDAKKPKRAKKTKSAIPVPKETVENATISTQDDLHSFEFDTMDIYGEKIDFDEACNIATSQFIDEAWITKRDEINAKVKEIKLKDMKPGAAFYVAAEIDAILDDIDDDYKRLNATMKLLTDSSYGVGTAIRKQGAAAGGKNTQEREAAGFNALTNAKINGKPLNLIQLLAATSIRLSFYQDTIKRLEQKRSALNIAASESRASAALAS